MFCLLNGGVELESLLTARRSAARFLARAARPTAGAASVVDVAVEATTAALLLVSVLAVAMPDASGD